jgi:glutamate-1-semialdehyde 2,1-aminomutase
MSSDRYQKSKQLFERAQQSLAGGVSSNVRKFDKPFPLYFEHGKGAHLYDADGNRYVDYVLGRGPLILGHTHPEVIEATCQQLWKGQVYAAQHTLEVELAERIVSVIPSAERVRFGISGSEAVHAALRLARAYTGRNVVVKFEGHYHGWLDNILYSLSPDPGKAGDADAPKGLQESPGQFPAEESHVAVLPWNNLKVLEEYLSAHSNEIAAVITEPIMGNTGVILPKSGYLERMRQLCTKYGIVLIFDEVITGFRVSLSGAQGLFGIQPDLSIFGKAIANGLPMSCLAGRADLFALIADSKVGHGGTYNSLPPAIAAAVATMRVLERDGGAVYRQLEASGSAVMKGIQDRAAALQVPAIVQGHPAFFYVAFPNQPGEITDYRSSLNANNELYARFVTAMADRGVRLIPRGNWFNSAAHDSQDVSDTLVAVDGALAEVAVPHYQAVNR